MGLRYEHGASSLGTRAFRGPHTLCRAGMVPRGANAVLQRESRRLPCQGSRLGRREPVMATAMNGERLIACQGGVRAARTLLSEAIKFAQARTTFGKKLSQSQVIRHKFAQMARRIEAAQAVVDNLAFAMCQGASPLQIGGPMALAKVECTSAAEYCVREAS